MVTGDSNTTTAVAPSRDRLAADLARIAAEEHWEPVPTINGEPDLTQWVQSQRSISNPVGGQRAVPRRQWKGGVRA